MRRNLRKEIMNAGFSSEELQFNTNVENFKRGRALPRLSTLYGLKFFDRVLHVRRTEELIFITKAAEKGR